MSVEITRLPSGLSVVTDRMPHLETASLGVWIGSGSRNENPDEHGISHLLEHMAFKGTKRRTARQIAEAIEAVGGDLNAATSAESTGYFARVLKADVTLALDVLSDILSDPTFDGEELRREQNVIVQEIGATEDAPDDLVFDRLQETAFPLQPIGRSILGTPDTVRSFNPARLRAYLSRNYRAPNMVVAGAGAVEHEAIVAEVEKRLAGFKGPAAPEPEPAHFRGGTRVETRELEQVHIAMALQGLPMRDEQLYSLQVFTSVLGGGMSSRLFQEVREVRGLCYAIHAFHMPFVDTGLFALYAGTDESDAPELMRCDRSDRQCHRDLERYRGQPRQGPDEGRAFDGAGKFRGARRPAGEANARIWTSDSARGDRQQGRCSDHCKRPCRRSRLDQPRQAGDRGARPR
jgi:predicted Zn-dependent peptidase